MDSLLPHAVLNDGVHASWIVANAQCIVTMGAIGRPEPCPLDHWEYR